MKTGGVQETPSDPWRQRGNRFWSFLSHYVACVYDVTVYIRLFLKVSKFKVVCKSPVDEEEHAIHTTWCLQKLCGPGDLASALLMFHPIPLPSSFLFLPFFFLNSWIRCTVEWNCAEASVGFGNTSPIENQWASGPESFRKIASSLIS